MNRERNVRNSHYALVSRYLPEVVDVIWQARSRTPKAISKSLTAIAKSHSLFCKDEEVWISESQAKVVLDMCLDADSKSQMSKRLNDWVEMKLTFADNFKHDGNFHEKKTGVSIQPSEPRQIEVGWRDLFSVITVQMA